MPPWMQTSTTRWLRGCVSTFNNRLCLRPNQTESNERSQMLFEKPVRVRGALHHQRRAHQDHEGGSKASLLIQCDQKKSPNVYKSCPKMIDFDTFTKIA